MLLVTQIALFFKFDDLKQACQYGAYTSTGGTATNLGVILMNRACESLANDDRPRDRGDGDASGGGADSNRVHFCVELAV